MKIQLGVWYDCVGRAKVAKRIQHAIKYLYGTPIEKTALTASVAILKVLRTGTKRGWLYPEEIAKLTKLTQVQPAVKKVGVGK